MSRHNCARLDISTLGTQLDSKLRMHMFVAGADVVRWELIALTPQGPYRLTMHHPRGSIVEYFKDPGAAMNRETELQELLTVVGKQGQSDPARAWIAASSGVN